MDNQPPKLPPTEEPLRITDDMPASARPKTGRIPFAKGMSSFPLLIVLIIIINIAVFLWEIATGALVSLNSVVAAGALYRENVLAGEWWRLISAAFLHGSLDHILGNTLFMYILGMAAEHAFGLVNTGLVYLAAAVSGSLLSLAMAPGPSIGASGAVFGLLGALIAVFYRNRDRYHLRDGGVGAFVAGLAGLAALDIFLGYSVPYIDNWCHLGGFLGGAAAGLCLRPAPAGEPEPVTPATKALTAGTVALFCAYLLFRVGYLAAVEATVYFTLNNTPAAVAAADEAIDRDPGNAYAYFLRGVGYLAEREYNDALVDLKHYLDSDPANDKALYIVGQIYYNREEYRQALDYFSRAVARAPADANYLNSRGYAYILTGDTRAARADFEAIRKINAKYAPAVGNLGLVSAIEGDYPSAIELLEKARSMDSSQDVLKNLIAGLENEREGRRREAAVSYAAFVKSVAKDRANWLAECRFAEERARALGGQ